MYNIRAPRPVTEKAWGLIFTDGIAKTENEYLANKLKGKGYKVETGKEPEPSKFADFTVEELIAYAKENGIDIGNATSANGIIRKISEAEKN